MGKVRFFQKIAEIQIFHIGILGRSQFQVDINMNACVKFQFDTKNFYACYFKAKKGNYGLKSGGTRCKHISWNDF